MNMKPRRGFVEKYRERPEEAKGIDHLKLPVGKVLSDPVKGEFLTLPLFGWVGIREQKNTPIVLLVVMLFRSVDDPRPRGTLQIELPVHEDTELATLAALERFGWDGRIWPEEEGWPPSGSDDEENILALLEQSGTLKNTMTFPPGEEGAAAQKVDVQRARGPFLMPPLPKAEGEPDEYKLKRFRELCANPAVFYRPGPV
jgi:hypothetical protein